MRRCIISIVIALAMALTVYTPVMATDTPDNYRDGKTLIVAGSDFQALSSADSDRKKIVSDVLSSMDDDGLTNPDQYLFVGDYSLNDGVDASVTNYGISLLKDVFKTFSPNISDSNIVLSAGNHDRDYSGGIGVNATGAYEFDDHIVYVINEKDFSSYFGNYGGQGSDGYKATVTQTATDLMNYLNGMIAAGDTRPVFVLCHVPLHVTNRLTGGGDSKYANYIFNVLNQAGAAGINIVSMYGHVHNGGGENYHGGAAVFLNKGDTIHIAQAGSTTKWDTRELNFVVMNAGYTGYFGGANGVDDTLTMSSFLLDDTSMTIARYDAAGIHNLKSAGGSGSTSPDYIDSNVYSSPKVVNYTTVDKTMLIKDIYTDDLDGVQQEELGYDVMSVSLDQTELNLRTDTEVQLTATVKPSTALDKSVTWTSSNPDVASVTQEGMVKSLTEGTATISVTTTDGNFTATCEVTVENIELTGLALDKSELTTYVGKKDTLNVQYTPENTTYPEVTWASSNSDVVTVDQEGNIEGKSLGSAVITATSDYDNTIVAQCNVTVAETSVEKVTLDTHQLPLLYEAKSKLTATITPADATNQGLVWSSSDEKVVKVDQQGNVEAVGAGEATITVTSEEGVASDSCEVKVSYESTYITSLAFDVQSLIIPKGNSYTYKAVYEPWYATNTNFEWKCYNGYAASFEDGTSKLTALHSDQTSTLVLNTVTVDNDYSHHKQATAELSTVQDYGYAIDWYVADGVLNVNSNIDSFANSSDAPWVKSDKAKAAITSIQIGPNVTKIGDNAFAGLDQITEVTVPDSVTELSNSAFPAGTKINGVGGDEPTEPTEPTQPTEPTEPAHEHTIVIDEAVEASCTEPGKTEGKHCSECGEVLVAQTEVKAKGHGETEIRNAVAATEDAAGYTGDTYCKECGTKLADGEIIPKLEPAHEHTIVIDEAVEASCTELGKTEGKHCSECGEVLVAQTEVKAKGHGESEIRNAVAATEEAAGYTGDTYCKECGTKLSDGEEIPKLEPATDPAEPTTTTEPTDPTQPTEPTEPEEDPADQKLPKAENVEQEIFARTTDGDIAGTKFYKLRAKIATATNTTETLSWSKVSGATGYVIYGTRCGSSYKYKKLKEITSGSTLSWKSTGLSSGVSYKYIVVAVKGKRVLANSKVIHAYTTGGKYTYYKSVKARKSTLTLKKGKTYALKGKGNKKLKKKKITNHRKICYETTNSSVATVTSGGTVKAVGKGKCYVYVYASNGVYKCVTVNVK